MAVALLEVSMTVAALAVAWQDAAIRRRSLVVVAGVCGFAAVTAVAAQVRIPLPFTPVPLTLQTFAVLLAAATLGAGGGAASQLLYVAAGACGLPVFAGFATGLAGVSAGYLCAFPLAAAAVGLISRRRTPLSLAVGLLAGTALIYLGGAGFLALGLGKSVGAALTLGIVPFIPGDAMKLVAASLLAPAVRRSYERFRGE
jgi:biotin transport system substrate-specific component